VTAIRWVQPGSAVVCIVGGRLPYLETLGLPFVTDVIGGIEAIGIPNEDTRSAQRRFPELPPTPPEVGPTAGIGDPDLLIGFGLYLASKISDGIIDDLTHDVYERIVRESLKKVWQKIRPKRDVPSGMTARFDHWFDGSGVLVRVVVHLDPRMSTVEDSTASAVTAALRQAVIYLSRNPVTHRVLTYHVHEGRVDPRPVLTEPIEPLTDET
jgi:hypothetical protein